MLFFVRVDVYLLRATDWVVTFPFCWRSIGHDAIDAAGVVEFGARHNSHREQAAGAAHARLVPVDPQESG